MQITPAEPSVPPPPTDVELATLGSQDWWGGFGAGLTICGKRVSNNNAKRIIFVGAAVLAVVTLTLVVVVLESSAAGPATTGGELSTPAPVKGTAPVTAGESLDGLATISCTCAKSITRVVSIVISTGSNLAGPRRVQSWDLPLL